MMNVSNDRMLVCVCKDKSIHTAKTDLVVSLYANKLLHKLSRIYFVFIYGQHSFMRRTTSVVRIISNRYELVNSYSASHDN